MYRWKIDQVVRKIKNTNHTKKVFKLRYELAKIESSSLLYNEKCLESGNVVTISEM